MTTATENQLINSSLKQEFEKINLSFELFPSNQIKSYKSLDYFYKFIEKEVEFWSRFNLSTTKEIVSAFQIIKNNLDEVLRFQTSNLSNSLHYLNQAVSRVQNVSGFIAFSRTPEVDFFKYLFEQDPKSAESALIYLCGFYDNNSYYQRMSSKKSFEGLLQGFLFKNPSVTTESRRVIENSLSKLRDQHYGIYNEMDTDYQNRKNEVEVVLENFKTETSTWKEEFFTKSEGWQDEFQKTNDIFLEEKRKIMGGLEEIYKEKLKLAAPAEYWRQTSTNYAKKGKNWMVGAVIATVLFIGFLTGMLFNLPLENVDLNANGFKFTVMITVIISMGVYLINYIVRMSISAYHLSRDAEERHQLTFVYLALKKDASVEDADRTIILQSLFCRADTGLLKGDSSPTFPEGALGKIAEIMGKR